MVMVEILPTTERHEEDRGDVTQREIRSYHEKVASTSTSGVNRRTIQKSCQGLLVR